MASAAARAAGVQPGSRVRLAAAFRKTQVAGALPSRRSHLAHAQGRETPLLEGARQQRHQRQQIDEQKQHKEQHDQQDQQEGEAVQPWQVLEEQWQRWAASGSLQQPTLDAGDARPSSSAAPPSLVPGTEGDSTPAAAGDAAADKDGLSSTLLPKLALLTTAMLWGSYAVSVRLLYSLPEPPDSVVLLAVRGIFQAGALLAVTLAMQPPQQQQPAQQQEDAQDAGPLLPAASSSSSSEQPEEPSSLLEQWLTQQSTPLWLAALELGILNYCGTALQTLGLQLTSATRASFLLQTMLIMTPVLSAVAGYRPARRVWGACALALAGTVLITADEAAGEGIGATWDSAGVHLGGDAAILSAALFYSLAVVRVTGYARFLAPVKLAAGKSVVLGGAALGALLVAAGSSALQGEEASNLWRGLGDPLCWAALLYTGLGPGALGSFLHVRGQKQVAPAEAQLVLSTKPLWAAGLAWVLLGGEQLGALTWVGGSTLVLAGIIAGTAPPSEPPKRALK